MRQEKNRVKAQEKYHVNKTTKTIYVHTALFDQVRKGAFVFIRSIISLPPFVFFNGYVPCRSIKCARAHLFSSVRSYVYPPLFFSTGMYRAIRSSAQVRNFFSSVRSYVSPYLFYVCSLRSQETFVFTFVFHPSPSAQAVVACCIWGPKTKIDYLVLNAKLLL